MADMFDQIARKETRLTWTRPRRSSGLDAKFDDWNLSVFRIPGKGYAAAVEDMSAGIHKDEFSAQIAAETKLINILRTQLARLEAL